MNKRASSSSSAKKPATKKAKVSKAVAAPSGKKTGNNKPKASSTKQEAGSNKASTSKAVTNKAGTSKAVTRNAVTSKAVTNKAGTSKAVTRNAVTSKAVANKAGASKADTSKAVTRKAGTSKADTNQAGTKKADSSKAGTKKVGTSKHKRAPTAAQYEKAKKESKRLKDEGYDEELDKYIVERILDKDISLEGVTKYKVKWLGYPDGQFTWVAVHSLANSMKQVLKWEREEGQNWKLKPLATKFDNAKRDIEIRVEYRRLTNGNYRIKEKYGVANGHAWYLMVSSFDDDDEQIVCLNYPHDPYYYGQSGMSIKDTSFQFRPGTWDNNPEADDE